MTDAVAVRIRRLPHGEGLALPSYATHGAAGMDVLAAEDVTLAPGARHAVATGFAVAIPPGYEIQVRPRSGLAPPAYATPGAAGMDVLAAEDVTLAPGARHAVATGFSVASPPGYEIQVRPRSGLALKHGISVPNTPGTIDSDYRGEVQVILVNLGQQPFEIRRGERIAQLVIARYERATLRPTDSLDDTGRGAGGFGSTGRG